MMECWSNAFMPSNIRFSGPGGEPVLSEPKDRFFARLASEFFLTSRQRLLFSIS
jgi:hypothetical protein